ncbi:MAG TPA: ISL3 family transposase [Nitriliruptorales bacterium]|nr:ISL3 family transposase [Nitriliruptorales bacterium]
MGEGTSSLGWENVSLLGVAGLRVVWVWEFADERQVLVETPGSVQGCWVCGQRAESGGRHGVQVRDLPIAGKATRLVWRKREWRCRDCRRSWRETHPQIAGRAALTERARAEAARQVGEEGRAVAAVAREFGVGWQTVMRAVRDRADQLFAAQQIYTRQTRPCLALGVDEKVMNRATRGRRRRYVTVIVDLARGVPLDIVEGRSRAVLRAWLAAQTPAWRAGVRIATLDPAAPYRAALTDPDVGLPNATLVLDHFHAVKLANAAIDDVRRRVQNQTLGHRGRKHDPLYQIRKLLLMARHRLDQHGAARVDAALTAGDPYDEVRCTHAAKELLRDVYAAPDRFAARGRLEAFFEWAAEVDVLEVTRLASTIDRWRAELMAYFRTGGASSGKVEAVNGELEAVDRTARGFRNFINYRTGCCSRRPSPGTLPSHQDSGAAALKANPPPPRSSRRPLKRQRAGRLAGLRRCGSPLRLVSLPPRSARHGAGGAVVAVTSVGSGCGDRRPHPRRFTRVPLSRFRLGRWLTGPGRPPVSCPVRPRLRRVGRVAQRRGVRGRPVRSASRLGGSRLGAVSCDVTAAGLVAVTAETPGALRPVHGGRSCGHAAGVGRVARRAPALLGTDRSRRRWPGSGSVGHHAAVSLAGRAGRSLGLPRRRVLTRRRDGPQGPPQPRARAAARSGVRAARPGEDVEHLQVVRQHVLQMGDLLVGRVRVQPAEHLRGCDQAPLEVGRRRLDQLRVGIVGHERGDVAQPAAGQSQLQLRAPDRIGRQVQPALL